MLEQNKLFKNSSSFDFSRKFANFVSIITLLSSSNGVIFHCDFKDTYWGTYVGELYTCEITQVTETDVVTLQEAKGYHLDGRTNADVKFLHAFQQTIRQLPRGMDRRLPNLIGMQLFNTELQSISAEDLRPFRELAYFSSWANKIKSIRGNLFRFSPNLKWLDFQNNSLQHVGHGLLDNLDELREAQFISNPCIDVYAKTRGALDALNLQLPQSCPPQIEECPTGCDEPIEILRVVMREENDELRSELTKQNEKLRSEISQLREEIVELIGTYEGRIAKLEASCCEYCTNPIIH